MNRNYSTKGLRDVHRPEIIEMMPRNTALEARLLNCIITTDYAQQRQVCQMVCQGQLDPAAFFHEPHRLIFLAIRTLSQHGQSISTDNITEWLVNNTRKDIQPIIDTFMLPVTKTGEVLTVQQRYDSIAAHVMTAAAGFEPGTTTMTTALYTGEDILNAMDALSVLNVSRNVILQIEDLKKAAYQHSPLFMDELAEAIVSMEKLLVSRGNQLVSARDVLLAVIQQAHDNQNPDHRRKPVLTPFRRLNEVGGLPESGMFLIAGDTGTGKTSLALNFASRNVADGLKVGYLNLEMPNIEMGERILAGILGIRLKALEYEVLTAEQMELLDTRGRQIAEASRNLYFENTAPRSKEDFMMMLRRMASQGCNVAYIDYMQILSWSTRDAHRDMTTQDVLAEIAREIHQEALKLQMLVIVLSQVNRDRDYSELTLERIRDSKQIADAAMGVLLINRPELYGKGFDTPEFRNVDARGKGLFYLAKNRNGERTKFLVEFVGSRFTYQDLSDEQPLPSAVQQDCADASDDAINETSDVDDIVNI